VPAAVLAAGPTLKVSLDAAPGVMSNATLVPAEAPDAVAASVYPLPVLSMLRSPNDAMPATAATVVVPESVPAPPLVPIATVTLPVKVVTRLPKASSPETSTAGAMCDPAWVATGWDVKISWLNAAALMLNPVDVASVRLPDVACSV